MRFDDSYLCIDMERTGRHLEKMIKNRGYSVRDIQDILHLSCPQPVYRWMRGQALPSVDHLYVLGKVLKLHMEELLVPSYGLPENIAEEARSMWRRISEYGWEYLRLEAA